MNNYDHKEIESKWQQRWEKTGLYKTRENEKKKKYYVLDMFPYPSGAGLHVGHPKGYIATDVFSRMKMMQGYNVLHPMGWDAFGLPAENFALKNNVHPRISTENNIKTFKSQLAKLGFSYDWEREINTTDPKFYKWTQWVFLKMFERGLAYESHEPINWCPSCRTGLSNEDLEGGKCERCGSDVEQKPMRQWVLKITDYADRLLYDLEKLPDWEESIKEMQKNWIGRSKGAKVKFKIISGAEQSDQSKGTVLFIHGLGGSSKENWFPWLKGAMEAKGRKVLAPDLPNPTRPKLSEWLLELKKLKKEFEGPLTIVGHSLGCPAACVFIDRENIKTDNLILVAPAGKNSKSDEELIAAGLPEKSLKYANKFKREDLDWENMKKLVRKSAILLSDNDPFIPLNAHADYEKLGPQVKIFKNKGHFNANFGITEFPEIIEFIGGTFQNGGIIEIFTTRPDTLFGATYFVVAPEHEIIGNFRSSITNYSEVKKYIERAKNKNELERTGLNKDKSGVRLEGLCAVNPVNNEKLPVFAADYVLSGYGTGAVMAVPAHDERDWEFAESYNEKQGTNNENRIKIIPVVSPADQSVFKVKKGQKESLKFSENKKPAVRTAEAIAEASVKIAAYTIDGISINSGFLNGLKTKEAKEKMLDWLEKRGLGERAVSYKIKDWVFSRQRYWGEPIPVVHCPKCGVAAVPEEDLPVRLPEVDNYEPSGTGESPLANIEDWVNTKCPECGAKARRETNTMPQWAGSSWYYLRFIDPKNDSALVGKDKDAYWSPVDFYVGGAEHATRHLIYARFWHKFLFDIGAVNYDEPFTRLQHVGLIMAEDGRKMSKRWGNVINPDEVVENYGADAMRVYEMFMGPFSQSVAWSTNGLVGARKFLERIWGLSARADKKIGPQKSLQNSLHKTIKKVGEDIEKFKLNTAVSAMMILVNEWEKEDRAAADDLERFLLILAPFAPHIAEEIWRGLGHKQSIFKEKWPDYDPGLAKDELIELVLQVNGRVRDRIKVAAGIEEKEALSQAHASEKIKKWTADKEIVKEIYIKNKLVNIVAK